MCSSVIASLCQICVVASENRPYGYKVIMGIIDQKIKGNFWRKFFIGYSCYISHGLHCDTLTVKILLVFPEIWTLLYRVIGSHYPYTEHMQTQGYMGSSVLTRGLSTYVGKSTRPIFMSYGHDWKH